MSVSKLVEFLTRHRALHPAAGMTRIRLLRVKSQPGSERPGHPLDARNLNAWCPVGEPIRQSQDTAIPRQ